MARAAVWGAGIALLLAAMVCGLFALFGLAAAEAPDVLVDPSDTWTEVALRCVMAILAAALTGFLFAAGCVLIARAARARERREFLWALPAALAAVWAIALAALLLAQRDEAVLFPDCDDFSFDPVAWADEGSIRHDRVAAGLSHCGTLTGLSLTGLEGILGRPDARADDARMYDGLVVYTDGKRVERAIADEGARPQPPVYD